MALAGQTPAHVAEHRTQAQDVGPDEDSRIRPLTLRIEKHAVRGAVGSLHLDVLFDDVGLSVRRACNGRGRNGHRAEAAPRKSRILDQTRVNEFVAHGIPPAAALLWLKVLQKSKGAYLPAVKLLYPDHPPYGRAMSQAGEDRSLSAEIARRQPREIHRHR